MISFLAGLFVGEGKYEEIKDNLDLERWFRLPKSHERRIHGHRHAGVRIVQEGATLVHALDAHAAHPGPFTVDDLLAYRTAREPTVPKTGAEPPQGHEESTIQKATAVTAGRVGTAISRNAELLAQCRLIEKKKCLYLARPRRRHCRVGATHRPHTVYGGLHPPYKWVTSARVRYNAGEHRSRP